MAAQPYWNPAVRETLPRAPLLLAVAFALGACGQTGPLYLPDNPPPRQGLSLKKEEKKPTAAAPGADVPALNTPRPEGGRSSETPPQP